MVKKRGIDENVKRAISRSPIGTGRVKAFCDPAFYHTAAILPKLKEQYYIEGKSNGKYIRMKLPSDAPIIPTHWEVEIDGRLKKFPIKKDSILTIRMGGKESDLYLGEMGFERLVEQYKADREKRIDGAKLALNNFEQKETQERFFWLAERVGHKLMDYYNLENRHIGSEVSARIPIMDRYNNRVAGTEIATRDLVMYGRDEEGKRLAFTFELQPKMTMFNMNKIWYGFSKKVDLNQKETEIQHSIILTHRITDSVANYLGLKKDRRGNTYHAAGEVSVDRLRELSDVIDTDEAKKVYEILAMMPHKKKELMEIKKDPVTHRINEYIKSLKRTVFAISDQEGEKIKQFIIFEDNKHGNLAPRIIDKESAGTTLYEAEKRERKRSGEDIFEELKNGK